MQKLSLTTFVDIVSASGIPKSTKTRNALKQNDYHPAKDYYKQIRERIISLHEKNKTKQYLENLNHSLNNENKRNNYSEIIAQYVKWMGNKKFNWFDPPYGLYEKEKISVRVNPELGLAINGKEHIIKLYFKSDKLSKAKADIIMGIMGECLQTKGTMSVLDVRRGKLFVPTKSIPMLRQTVDAEIAYISQFLEA